MAVEHHRSTAGLRMATSSWHVRGVEADKHTCERMRGRELVVVTWQPFSAPFWDQIKKEKSCKKILSCMLAMWMEMDDAAADDIARRE